jgi:hypothetical protein
MRIKRIVSRVRRIFYPYYISIVGEMILNPDFWKGREHEQWDAGRIEVYKDGPYAEKEIRFFTNKEEWFAFRESSDFKSYNKRGINKLRTWVKENFDHIPDRQ